MEQILRTAAQDPHTGKRLTALLEAAVTAVGEYDRRAPFTMRFNNNEDGMVRKLTIDRFPAGCDTP